MELTSTSKRVIKSLRNLVFDPLPRAETLEVSRIDVDGPTILFTYRVRRREYINRVILPAKLSRPLRDAEGPVLRQLLTAMALAFGASLYKLSDFAEIDVRTAPLDLESRSFFEDFFQGGMGEFRFLQGLNPSRRSKVTGSDGPRIDPVEQETEDRLLLLNGGGKDTIVAAELLKDAGQPFTWLTIRPNPTRRKVVELSGVSESLEVNFEIDERIEKDSAYPWGHVPFVSIALTIGLLVALLTKARYVATGNELSANYGNTIYRGFEVNHQYTKSFAFEKGFSNFANRRVTSSVEIFSILRPFHDLQLARLFATHKKYLGHFISCNRGIAHGEWCKSCPKCAFTALALRPFLSAPELVQVFGEDVFDRQKIRKHILDLVRGTIKPWECVGTREECALALGLIFENEPELDFRDYPRRADLERALSGIDLEALRASILVGTNDEHLIPDSLVERMNRGQRRCAREAGRIGRSAIQDRQANLAESERSAS